MVHNQGVFIIIQVGASQQSGALKQTLGLFRAIFGQRDIAALFVFFVIAIVELQDNRMHLHI